MPTTKYQVMVTVLDQIDREAGFYEHGANAGQPKKVIKRKKGDIVEFHEDDMEQVERLVQLKALRPVVKAVDADKGSPEQKGGASSPSQGQRPQGQASGQQKPQGGQNRSDQKTA